MSLSQESFQADCVLWNGYKPCTVQKAESRSDCFGCKQYEIGPVIYHLGSQSSFDPNLIESAEKLGIVEMGGLGSILRTSAVTRVVRKINPDASIRWFTHERGAELLKYVPGVLPIDIENTNLGSQKDLVTSLDVLLNFEVAEPAKEVVKYAQNIGGFALNAQGKFYGVSPYGEYIQRLQVDDDFRLHNQLTMQQVLMRSVGLESHDAKYDVALSGANYRQADRTLRRAFGDEPPAELIGLNIGTSKNGWLRRWPAEYHAALAKQLAEAHTDKGIAILSGPQDDEVRARVIANLGQTGANLAVLPNNLEIGNFIGVVNRLSVLVTSNTFALHAALSQGVRVVTFENPLPPQEMELTAHDVRLGPKLECGPCYNRCTQVVKGQCMKEISVGEAVKGVETLLSTYKQRH